MISISVTYEDFNGNQHDEKFWFHLNKADLTELDIEYDGNFKDLLLEAVDSKNLKKIYEYFKAILLKSYGKRTEDGLRFVKKQEYLDEFVETDAYSEVLDYLMEENNAKYFIEGVLPKSSSASQPVLMPLA